MVGRVIPYYYATFPGVLRDIRVLFEGAIPVGPELWLGASGRPALLEDVGIYVTVGSLAASAAAALCALGVWLGRSVGRPAQ